MKQRSLVIPVLELLALLSLLFAPEAAPAADRRPLRLGVIQSLTGIAAQDGTTVVQALRLAEEKLEKDHPGSVELLVEDDESSDYTTRYREEPRIYADNSYDALYLMHAAFTAAQKQNASLRDALRSVEMDGLAGRYRYDPAASFNTGSSSLVCVERGALRVVHATSR